MTLLKPSEPQYRHFLPNNLWTYRQVLPEKIISKKTKVNGSSIENWSSISIQEVIEAAKLQFPNFDISNLEFYLEASFDRNSDSTDTEESGFYYIEKAENPNYEVELTSYNKFKQIEAEAKPKYEAAMVAYKTDLEAWENAKEAEKIEEAIYLLKSKGKWPS